MSNAVINTDEWVAIYEASALTIDAISKETEINKRTIRKYLYHGRIPSKANLAKMEKAMFTAKKTPRLKFHPSYGYATEEQINRLKEIGVGHERDAILKAIEKQTANNGKFGS